MPALDHSFNDWLVARDFKTQITPNETQRTTLIVAGSYVAIIAILWSGFLCSLLSTIPTLTTDR